MKNLLTEEGYKDIKNRLDALTEDNERQWGKMTHGQMVHHCQGPLNIMMQKKDYGLKPNWFIKALFKKSLYSDKPWKKNLPTAKSLKETQPREFASEKKKLEQLVDELYNQRDRESWPDHPAFGYFTNEQWGKMQYKHLDHHLTQFGL